MEKFTTHTGIGVPLRRSDVDTDQIIPAEYLKRVTRTGFEDGLFAAWRNDPAFVLNNPAYAAGSVLVAGPNFGTGSSREHAVWALQNYGFKAVLSPRFGDIFRGNSGKAGLLTGRVDEKTVQRLWDHLEANPGATVTVVGSTCVRRPVTVRPSWSASVTRRPRARRKCRSSVNGRDVPGLETSRVYSLSRSSSASSASEISRDTVAIVSRSTAPISSSSRSSTIRTTAFDPAP